VSQGCSRAGLRSVSQPGLLSWMLEPTPAHPGPAQGPDAARLPSTQGLLCSCSFELGRVARAAPGGAGSSPGKAPGSRTQPVPAVGGDQETKQSRGSLLGKRSLFHLGNLSLMSISLHRRETKALGGKGWAGSCGAGSCGAGRCGAGSRGAGSHGAGSCGAGSCGAGSCGDRGREASASRREPTGSGRSRAQATGACPVAPPLPSSPLPSPPLFGSRGGEARRAERLPFLPAPRLPFRPGSCPSTLRAMPVPGCCGACQRLPGTGSGCPPLPPAPAPSCSGERQPARPRTGWQRPAPPQEPAPGQARGQGPAMQTGCSQRWEARGSGDAPLPHGPHCLDG